MAPPAWFFTIAVLMTGLAIVAPGHTLIRDPWTLLGLLAIGAGLALNFLALATFRRHATTSEPEGTPSQLVVDGPYRRTRNPMYLGGIVILSGYAVLLGSLTPMLLPPVYALIAARSFVPREEARMRALFGIRWDDYRGSVRRWM